MSRSVLRHPLARPPKAAERVLLRLGRAWFFELADGSRGWFRGAGAGQVETKLRQLYGTELRRVWLA